MTFLFLLSLYLSRPRYHPCHVVRIVIKFSHFIYCLPSLSFQTLSLSLNILLKTIPNSVFFRKKKKKHFGKPNYKKKKENLSNSNHIYFIAYPPFLHSLLKAWFPLLAFDFKSFGKWFFLQAWFFFFYLEALSNLSIGITINNISVSRKSSLHFLLDRQLKNIC